MNLNLCQNIVNLQTGQHTVDQNNRLLKLPQNWLYNRLLISPENHYTANLTGNQYNRLLNSRENQYNRLVHHYGWWCQVVSRQATYQVFHDA